MTCIRPTPSRVSWGSGCQWIGGGPLQLRHTDDGCVQQLATEHEEVPMPSIVGGFDIHRKQLTFGYLDTVSGEVTRGQITPADRGHLRAWLARLENPQDAAFAAEACTGWRYVTEELARAGVQAHLA